MSRVAGVFVGTPKTYIGEDGKPWRSAIFKYPVDGPVELGFRILEGDAVADKKNHGSPDMAVCVYPASHYALWNVEFGSNLGPGCVGENLAIEEQNERTVCIGDVYEIGTALVQVSQPRFPCYKQERRTGVEGFLKAVFATRRTGWYLRVLQPGTLQTGDGPILVERPLPEITVDSVNLAMYGNDRDAKRRFASIGLLSEAWRDSLIRKAES